MVFMTVQTATDDIFTSTFTDFKLSLQDYFGQEVVI